MHLHERVKTALALHADANDAPRVKPFVLVIDADVAHATGRSRAAERRRTFMGGCVRGEGASRCTRASRGWRATTPCEKLLTWRAPKEPTEVVIHVDMLKEGWDVSNLYTIIPLRAAESRTLVEQSIGRGLRLPYGRRVNVAAVDRLTIVAHDRFQEIVDEANKPRLAVRSMDGSTSTTCCARSGPTRPVEVPSMADADGVRRDDAGRAARRWAWSPRSARRASG
jgi:type III restriction enzyme